MAKSFEPAAVECGWYDWWQDQRVFEARSGVETAAGEAREPFSMILPPPNVTGALHIGHALTVAVQDALARWQRMRGREVLWIPGLDHAGIATQAVVEKRLHRDEGLSRHDLGRDAFVSRVQGWREEYGSRIDGQIRRMGASLDWSRGFFTLDEQRSAAVYEAFRRLFASGMVYRGSMLVNWCPALRTAISDIEVDVKQLDGPTRVTVPAASTAATTSSASREVELGWIETFEYRAEASAPPAASACAATGRDDQSRVPDTIRVATTRLETMLGDSAVAVHPDDPRYASLVGRMLVHPLTGRRIPVVADAELVDMEIGTGAVKVTPAHDPNDWACGQRHDLPVWTVLDKSGRVTSPESGSTPVVPADFVGLDRFEAREAVRAALQATGSYVGREPRAMAIAVCSRSGDVLEPLVQPQWWVSTQDMAARALSDVSEGRLEMRPDTATREWEHWLRGGSAGADRARDWCVSRQLWWGHRIPAWRVERGAEGGLHKQQWRVERGAEDGFHGTAVDGGLHQQWRVFEGEEWVVAADRAEALQVAEAASAHAGCIEQARAGGIAIDEPVSRVEQDEDVLDTWFSSGLLPLSALGWPHAESGGLDPELARFYPLSVMETGQDILFFWVARMAMLCAQLPQQWEVSSPANKHMAASASSPGADTATGTPSEQATGTPPPFHRVLLHGMVRDAEGRKMSKSLGNVIDPLAVADGRTLEELLADVAGGNVGSGERERADKRIRSDFPDGLPGSGVDAMRGALLHLMQGSGQDVSMDLRRVHGWRLFANKLWNASRFIISNADQAIALRGADSPGSERAAADLGLTALPVAAGPSVAAAGDVAPGLPLHSRWLLHRVATEAGEIHSHLESFDVGAAAARVMALVHSDLCDVAIEWSKPALRHLADAHASPAERQQAVEVAAALAAALDGCLRLAHPLIPFVTEELWQRLQRQGVEGDQPRHCALPASISLAAYPGTSEDSACDISAWLEPELDAQMNLLVQVVSAARAATSAAQRITGQAFRDSPKHVVVECASSDAASLLEANSRELCFLLGVEADRLDIRTAADTPPDSTTGAGLLMQYAGEGVRAGVRLPSGEEAQGALRKEVLRLSKRGKKRQGKMEGMRKRLAAPGFAKAADAVQQAHKAALAEEEATAAADADLIAALTAAITESDSRV